MVLVILWIGFKAVRLARLRHKDDSQTDMYKWRFMWVRLSSDPQDMCKVLDGLKWLKPNERNRTFEDSGSLLLTGRP